MHENRQMLIGWRKIDTTFAETFTDERLLAAIEYLPIGPGWGLIAELMKRHERNITSKTAL
tara:strand:+ start:307 stop:489 length:183 start_codon:yes stop_codon:yes gene_type:complete